MSFQIGDIVWVQIQGFPWWPAKVIEPSSDSVPSDVLAGRQGTEDTLVQFYSTKDYSWMVSSDQSSIRHFGQHLKLLQQPKMKNDISLKRAVGLAKKEYEQVVMGGQSVSPQTPTTTLTASVSDSNKNNNKNNNKKKVKSEKRDSDENNDDDEKSRVKKVKSEHSKKRSRKQRDEGSDYEDNDDDDGDDEEEAAESEKKDHRSKRKKSSNDDDDESDDDNDKTTKKQRTKKSTTTTAAAAVKKEPEKKKVKSEKLDVKSTTSSVKTETPKTPTKKSSTTATTPSSVSVKKEDSKTPTKKKSSDTKVKSEKLSDNSSVTKQEKQEKLTRVTLTDDQLEKCNAKLDRFINDGNNEKILEAVRFLHSECEPLTIAQLTKVKIGRTMKRLTKSSNEMIKQYSSSLVRSWTQLATGVQKSATQTPTPSSSSVKTGGAKNSNSASSSPTTPTTPTNSSKSNNNKANEVDESLLNLTGDNMRDFARKKIANGLATGTKNHQKCASLAIMIEEAMFDHFGKKSTDEGYKTQMRSVAYNLADPSNPDFVQVVLMGGVPPSKVASMSSKDMASNELKAERERIQQEATRESLTATPAQTATSMFTCRRCKSQNCTYYQMQTRSADEPMTVFVTCLTCDTRWKC